MATPSTWYWFRGLRDTIRRRLWIHAPRLGNPSSKRMANSRQYEAESVQFRGLRRAVCAVQLRPGLPFIGEVVRDARTNVGHLARRDVYHGRSQ